MNLLQLVLKNMRQRALSTWLTLLSVTVGVGLAIAIMILHRGSASLFGQTDYGFDVLVGKKASPTQLVLNTVYHLDQSPGNIPYSIYENLNRPRNPLVRLAVPIAVGDTYKGQRIIGTSPRMFGFEDGTGDPLEGYDEQGRLLPGYQSPDLAEDDRDPNKPVAYTAFQYRPGRKYVLAEGRMFHPQKFEAIVGADIPRLTGLKIGDKYKPQHGQPTAGGFEDEHEEEWEVVGVLDRTHTAADRALYIPLISFYTIPEHKEALEAMADIRAGIDVQQAGRPRPPSPAPATAATKPDDRHAQDPSDPHAGHDHGGAYHLDNGLIHLELPKEKWQLSAILVKTRGGAQAMQLMYAINNGNEAAAVNPATVMREFFDVFLSPSSRVLQGVAFLVIVVAGVGILVSIYNSVAARKREIAILRALGATKGRILALICLEAGLIGLVGGVLGVVAGHLIGAAGSIYMRRLLGEGLNWLQIGPAEVLYLGVVTLLAIIAGLVPALKAYRTPVATNLVAG